jgi:hypothetical protein
MKKRSLSMYGFGGVSGGEDDPLRKMLQLTSPLPLKNGMDLRRSMLETYLR